MQPLTSYRELYQATLRKWGEAAQYDQAVEECAELIATLKHLRRGRVDETAVAEELADVYLMVGQLAYMIGEARVAAAVERKLERLRELLAEP
jgi:NTP pyrophosphatase (non-canonical NTP hydrolase)